jgi:hypothetical protein
LIDDNAQLNDFCGLFSIIDSRSGTVPSYTVLRNGSFPDNEPTQADIIQNGACSRELPIPMQPPVSQQDLPLMPKGYLFLLLGITGILGGLAVYRVSH